MKWLAALGLVLGIATKFFAQWRRNRGLHQREQFRRGLASAAAKQGAAEAHQLTTRVEANAKAQAAKVIAEASKEAAKPNASLTQDDLRQSLQRAAAARAAKKDKS